MNRPEKSNAATTVSTLAKILWMYLTITTLRIAAIVRLRQAATPIKAMMTVRLLHLS
jgi:hypothetical protein